MTQVGWESEMLGAELDVDWAWFVITVWGLAGSGSPVEEERGHPEITGIEVIPILRERDEVAVSGIASR
jgi:hypothetical protein